MSTAEDPTPKNTRLHREDWLAHALETLRCEGISGLRVEPLARSLGVTTGSFYWHFKDRRDLLQSVLAHWMELMTDAIEERRLVSGGPKERLARLLRDITVEERNRYDLAVRNWATFDEMAHSAVRKVDEGRLSFCMELFLGLGFTLEEAEVRSRMLMFYQVGEVGFSIPDSLEKRLEYVDQRIRILAEHCDQV